MKFNPGKLLVFLDREFTLSRRQLILAALIIFLAGFGLRYSYLLLRERPPRDEQFYIQTVEKMTENDDSRNRDYEFGPLMPAIAVSLVKLGFEPATALRTLNMVYSMLWILVMFFLCRDVFGNNKAGLLGMAIASFNPYTIRMSSQILREPLYLLIFTLSLWCALRFIKSKKYNIYPAILGLLTVLGFLTRYEGIEISLFMLLAVIIIFMQYKWQRIRMCIYGLAAYLFTVGVIIGALINFDNAYICNTNQKAIEYYKLFTGNRLK
jgi:4-amino-4-deoxy-L-arabinose transferase-like glycosyltransferase